MQSPAKILFTGNPTAAFFVTVFIFLPLEPAHVCALFLTLK